MTYWHYIIIISSALLLYIITTLIINYYKEKILYEELNLFCEKNKYTFTKVTKMKYDFIITSSTWEMYGRICKVPKNSSVTINSKSTWCLRFGGGYRKGRNYPNKRYLTELTPFLNGNFSGNKDNIETYRVVILYPTTESILKYVNESDIIEVRPNHTSYGYKVIKYNDFFSKFEQLLEIKK